jgi:hypothetical protein
MIPAGPKGQKRPADVIGNTEAGASEDLQENDFKLMHCLFSRENLKAR